MNLPEYDPNDTAAQLAPVLDEAINELSASDRAAILLRFFEQHDLRAVGHALGSSEDAAQKRVGRALEKLRVILVRRGVALPSATLATVLAAQAVTVAPAGLAVSVSTAAFAGAAAGTATTFSLINIMTMTKLKGAVLGTLLVGAGSTLVLQQQSKAKLRDENLSLLQKYEQFTGLQADNARLSNQLVNAHQAESLSRDQLSELLRLRGEVALARNQKADLDKTREENRRLRPAGAAPAQQQEAAPAQDDYPKESWTFAGYATPEAAFQSTVWAISHGDVQTMLASLTPDERSRKQERWQGKTEEEIAEKNRAEFEQIKGFRILKKETLSDDEVVLTLFVEGLSPNEGTPRMKLVRIGTEWKSAGPHKDRSK